MPNPPGGGEGLPARVILDCVLDSRGAWVGCGCHLRRPAFPPKGRSSFVVIRDNTIYRSIVVVDTVFVVIRDNTIYGPIDCIEIKGDK